MKRSAFCVLAALACGACANGGASLQGRRIGTGLVVEYGLAHSGVEPKEGLQAMSDKGARLFGGMMEGWYGGASTNSYIAGHLPKTVRVTWRTDTVPGQRFTTGRVIGDYLIEVDKRVPDEVDRAACRPTSGGEAASEAQLESRGAMGARRHMKHTAVCVVVALACGLAMTTPTIP
jgi:hypothetical protein